MKYALCVKLCQHDFSIRGVNIEGAGGAGGAIASPIFCQNRRRRREAAARRIPTCPPSFRKLLTPLSIVIVVKWPLFGLWPA